MAQDDNALLPAGVVKERMRELAATVSWIGTARASEILNVPVRQLRRRAVRWEAMMEGGNRPTVRVRRKGDSHWLFCEEDCWANRKQPVCIVEDSTEDVDEDEAIAKDIVRRHFG